MLIALHGAQGDTPLTALPSRPESFERGSTDDFDVELPYVGALTKITIGHNGRGGNPDWHLDSVEVTDPETRAVYFFPAGRWLGSLAADGLSQATLLLGSRDMAPAGHGAQDETEYTITFHTSKVANAGTDAAVSVQLVGQLEDSKTLRVPAKPEAFSAGRADTFSFRLPYVGQLSKLVVSHDNSGRNPAWHLAQVRPPWQTSQIAPRLSFRRILAFGVADS